MHISDVIVLLVFLTAIVNLMSSIIGLAKLFIEKMILNKIKLWGLKRVPFFIYFNPATLLQLKKSPKALFIILYSKYLVRFLNNYQVAFFEPFD